MEIADSFRVSTPIDETWKVLLDIERIAPALPGAQLQEVEGAEYRGVVKIKVGPISAQYRGTAKLAEVDEPNHRIMIDASGRDTRGQGNAKAQIVVTMRQEGAGTNVEVVTDLAITGKVAQLGRGMLADVSSKLMGQFVDNLERDVLTAAGGGDTSHAGGPYEQALEEGVYRQLPKMRDISETRPAAQRVGAASDRLGHRRAGRSARGRGRAAHQAPGPDRDRGARAVHRLAHPPRPRPKPLVSEPVFDPAGPVMGIDPGVSRCGYGVVTRADGRLHASACGVIRTPRADPLPQRLVALADELASLVAHVRPSALAVERVLFQANTRTAMSVGQASGVALITAARAHVPVALYSPTEVKLAVTGDGRADKTAVQTMVTRLLALRDIPKPADAADALALACCHIGKMRLVSAVEAAR